MSGSCAPRLLAKPQRACRRTADTPTRPGPAPCRTVARNRIRDVPNGPGSIPRTDQCGPVPCERLELKAFISLAVALTVIPASVAAAQSAGPPTPATTPDLPPGLSPAQPDAAELRARVRDLSAQATAHSRRLGLVSTPVRPAASVEALIAQERRLSRILGFLTHRKEVREPIGERGAPRRGTGPRGSELAARIAREHTRAVRRALRVGVEPPTPLRVAPAAGARRAQLARLTTISEWLARRTERIRPHERPLSQRLRYYDALTCIAQHESHGAWDIATGNGYYGGLQMDRQFQSTYAPGLYRTKGTADHWTREEQMRTAERAISTRGFHPWPNTARACGLL